MCRVQCRSGAVVLNGRLAVWLLALHTSSNWPRIARDCFLKVDCFSKWDFQAQRRCQSQSMMAVVSTKPPIRLHSQRLTTSILRSLHVCRRTFSVETKSAVSSRVNWLIWSTIVAILGFAGAAAASDCHLRCILCCAPPTAGRAPIAGRAVQTQRLRARDAGADMLCCVDSAVDGMDGSRRACRTFLRFCGRQCTICGLAPWQQSAGA